MGSITGLVFLLSWVFYAIIFIYEPKLEFNINQICKVLLIAIAVFLVWAVITLKPYLN